MLLKGASPDGPPDPRGLEPPESGERPGTSSRRPLIERVAGWSISHRALAITGWLALVIVAVLSSAVISLGDAPSSDPGESGRVKRVLDAQPDYEPILENVLIQARSPGGAARFGDDPGLRAATQDLETSLRALPGAVTGLRSPLTPDRSGAQQLSRDGRSGLVTFFVGGPNDRMRANYDVTVKTVAEVAARHPGVRVAQAGDQSLAGAVDNAIKDDFGNAETTSLPITLLILVLVFGALIAAAIPLLLAATTVVSTFGLLGVIGHWVPVNSATSSMILLIGVAVGTDYSLFYLRREREERVAGRDVAGALRISAHTSGRVVIVSGLTVMLCVAGLFFTGLDVFRGLTVGTVLVVGLAMVGSVTVLPALLAALGRWVDRPRVPWLGRRRATARESRVWLATARAVVEHPLLWGGAAVWLLIFLAVPMFGMHLQDPAVVNSLPRSVPTVDAAVRMQQAFPGAPTPARLAIWRTDGGAPDGPATVKALDALRARVAADQRSLLPPISTVKVDDVLVVRIPLAGSGTDPASDRALENLRDRVLPATLGQVDGLDYAVGGRTAFAYDFAPQLTGRTPVVVGFVLALAFVLLALAFRSLAIPVVSIALNLLSMGAAYGVLTWVFQDGHFASLLGFASYGGVVGWLPLFMFVMLFGLSMDYHIFILSRIREHRAAGAAASDSVIAGVGASAGVVTSAAVIMMAVFTVFTTLSAIEYKMLGVGMAVGILIDATIVRGVLLPAAMALLGESAWAGVPAGRRGRGGA